MLIPDDKDIAILENCTFETLQSGCRDCGHKQVVFQVSISIEQDVKVFLISVECPKCDTEYTEIMTMREINNEHDTSDND